MDLSALIFVALAVAWAVYLIPKALKHHDDVVRSRSVDRFSHTMRVLARREPVNKRSSRLVVSPGRAPSSPIVTTKTSAAARPGRPTATERASTRVATQRRRRVLGVVLLGLLATVGVAAFDVVSWWYVAIPTVVLLAWLVACRLMVRHERNARFDHSLSWPITAPADEPVAEDPVADALEDTAQTPAITDPSLWDPMPVTLPTYVSKPAAARRTVRTIDLDSTGVWTSGRTEADAAIAREADDEAARIRTARAEAEQRRATGS